MCRVNWEFFSQLFHITLSITGKQLQCLKQVHEETHMIHFPGSMIRREYLRQNKVTCKYD